MPPEPTPAPSSVLVAIAPPLTASEEQVAEALKMLDIAFAQVQENF